MAENQKFENSSTMVFPAQYSCLSQSDNVEQHKDDDIKSLIAKMDESKLTGEKTESKDIKSKDVLKTTTNILSNVVSIGSFQYCHEMLISIQANLDAEGIKAIDWANTDKREQASTFDVPKIVWDVSQAELDAITVPIVPKKYILFDLDNTLIDSEFQAFMATPDVINAVLAAKGIPDRYTATMLTADGLFGKPFKVMLKTVLEKHGIFPTDAEFKRYWRWEEEAVVHNITTNGKACKGVIPIIEKLLQDGTYKLAIVSSSSLKRMLGCMDGTGIRKYFSDDCIFSAASSLAVPTSKPAPDIYEFALEKLGITADDAVAVEDSITGVMAAVAADIQVFGYVGCINMPMMQDELARDFGREGVVATMMEWSEFWEMLPKVAEKSQYQV